MGHPERAVNPEETHYNRAPVFHIFPPVLHDWKTLGSIQGALQKTAHQILNGWESYEDWTDCDRFALIVVGLNTSSLY